MSEYIFALFDFDLLDSLKDITMDVAFCNIYYKG